MSIRLLFLAVFMCSVRDQVPLHDAMLVPSSGIGAGPYFRRYLNECSAEEIRCLYFLQGSLETGMVMTLNLGTNSVFTARDIYDYAVQHGHSRPLDSTKIRALRTLLSDLPPSEDNLPYSQSLFIAFRRNKRLHINWYSHLDPPSVVQQIYELGGGYLDTSPDNRRANF